MKFVKYGTFAFNVVGPQCKSLSVDGINDPSRQELGGVPTALSFEELFHRDRLLLEFLGRVKQAQDFVSGMEQDPSGNASLVGVALNNITELVNIHIGVT
jgi:hypothetical protein